MRAFMDASSTTVSELTVYLMLGADGYADALRAGQFSRNGPHRCGRSRGHPRSLRNRVGPGTQAAKGRWGAASACRQASPRLALPEARQLNYDRFRGRRQPERREPMPSHKFNVGDTVAFKPGVSRYLPIPPGCVFEVIKVLPGNGEPEYRIKSADEEGTGASRGKAN